MCPHTPHPTRCVLIRLILLDICVLIPGGCKDTRDHHALFLITLYISSVRILVQYISSVLIRLIPLNVCARTPHTTRYVSSYYSYSSYLAMAQAEVSITLCLKLESSANISTALTDKKRKRKRKRSVNYTLLEIRDVCKHFNGL
jgi:hypothetical protein